MAISTVKLNGETIMTVNDTTTDASEVLSGQYFYAADGTKTQGSIATKTSSDLTVSGATVTASAGYYASDASKAVASGSAATPTTTITANPSISVNSSTGLITASVSGSQNITPTVNAGYVASGTAGKVSVSGSNTSQLSTQAAKTVTPTESSQTAVAAGKYTTGAVTVGAISSTYVGSGITQRSNSDLTASGATITAPAGYYASAASKSVASGTAGVPTATKGTVSNHSVSITPSVTNTTGYISGGTKTGTAVTVSASELTSGNKAITENGTDIDVVGYSTVSVDVPTGGSDVFVVEFTWTVEQDPITLEPINSYWEPTCTFAAIQAAYNSGQDIVLTSSSASYQVSGSYEPSDEALYYAVIWWDDGGSKFFSNYYIFNSNGVTDDGGGSLIPTPTESISITQNGTVDVTNYAEAVVNVPTGTTITSLSVTANGTYTAPSGIAYSPVTVNVPTGGGASNCVTGTFTGTTTGAAMNVPLNYSGSGHPIAVLIFPSEGIANNDSGADFYPAIQRYAIASYVGVSYGTALSGQYTTASDSQITVRYKGSATNATSFTNYPWTANDLLSTASASGASAPATVKITSATTMSVFIASDSYGFMANIPYTYCVIYSS